MQEKNSHSIKNSPWLILSRTVQAVKTGWVVVGALIAFYVMLEGKARFWICILLAYYGWTRVYVIFYDWVAWRYHIDSKGISAVRGIFTHNTQYVAWCDVASVSSASDPVMQWKKLASIVITPLGVGEKAIELHSIDSRLVNLVRAYVLFSGNVRDQELSNRRAYACESICCFNSDSLKKLSVIKTGEEEVEIANLPLSDCFLFVLSKLYFLSLIPMSLGAVNSVIVHSSYSNDRFLQVKEFLALNFADRVQVGLLVLFLSLIISTVLTWIKYGNSLTSISDRSIRYGCGIMAKAEQEIPIDAIETIKVRQNFMMRILRRYSISVYGVSAHMQENFSGILSPFARSGDAKRILSVLGIVLPRNEEFSHHHYSLIALCVNIALVAYLSLADISYCLFVGPICVLIFFCGYRTYWGRISQGTRWKVVHRSFFSRESLFLRKENPYPESTNQIRISKKNAIYCGVIRYLGKTSHKRLLFSIR